MSIQNSLQDSLCIIYSESKNVPENYLKLFSSGSHLEYFDIDKLSPETIIRKGIGVFCNLNEKNYIITCFHIIGNNNIKVNAIYFDIKTEKIVIIPLKIKNLIPELDIAVLEIANKIQKKIITNSIISHDIFKLNEIKDRDNNIYLLSCEIDNESHKIIYTQNKIKNIVINNGFLVSTLIPKIPLVEFDPHDIDILSGSLLISNNKIISIVSNINHDTHRIESIPMILLSLISLSTIKRFMFSTLVADISDNSEKSVGHVITNSYNISYNNYSAFQIFSFKQNDIICEIDDIKFNNDGTIYDTVIGCNLNLDTFMMIKCSHVGKIKIKYCRKFFGKYKEYTNELIGIECNKIFQVNIFNNNKYVYYKGYIFTELSEELINNLKLFNDYKTNIGTEKIIVLINSFDKDFNYSCPLILDKIQNKKINSLKELKMKLEENIIRNKKNIFNFISNSDEKVKYTFN
jgi:hypothetical protein